MLGCLVTIYNLSIDQVLSPSTTVPRLNQGTLLCKDIVYISLKGENRACLEFQYMMAETMSFHRSVCQFFAKLTRWTEHWAALNKRNQVLQSL
jgi:hypothetical protein